MKRLVPWLRWASALALLVTAALLCWQCIDIYVTGNSPANLDENGVHIAQVYTAEDVGQRLRSLVVPFAACVALSAAAVLAARHVPKEKERHALTAENRLRLMKKRVESLPAQAEREEKLRRNTWIAAAAVLVVCAAMSLAYLLNGENFTSWDLEHVMGAMLLHVGPWVVLGLAAVYAAGVICDRSMLRECEALRGAATVPAKDGKAGKSLPVPALRIMLYAAAIVFIVLGVMNGGLYDVLVKAIMICTECIGLG